MRWLTTLAVFPFIALICWIGGYDFDTRGFLQAYGFIVACVIAGFTYWYPGWDCENCPSPKKLTFEEWLHHRFPAGVDGYAGMLNVGDLEQCWKVAQENM